MKTLPYPIFLVEDNSLYLKAFEKYLTEHLKINVNIHTFSNGEECQKNMSLKPKIIVLDYFLNSAAQDAANGLEVLKKIKTTDPNTAVIMLSSQDNIKVATDIMSYGAFDYVSKNENSFLRVLNAINNIDKMITQAYELKISRQIKWVLVGWIILLIGIAVVIRLFFPDLMNRNA